MGTRESAFWKNTVTGVPKRERRSGTYEAYTPDHLSGSAVALPPATDALLAAAERRARSLTTSTDLAGISRFLLRSEAIASSRIEGITPSARQVALAELGQREGVRGVGEQAQLVANNVTVVREATQRLALMPSITVDAIVDVHAALLPTEPHHHGLRAVQNWIGGSDWHPLDADFIPPPPPQVRPLMDDLVAFMNGAAHSPIAQAALTHAQFETIHPFTDGNGRVGRALIHTVLARRGITSDSVLPISLVFATLRDRYVDGLTSYRTDAAPLSAEGIAARAGWVHTFAETTIRACEQAERIAAELGEIRADWDEKVTTSRGARGTRTTPRADSAIARILTTLPATPVLTAGTVAAIHDVSEVAAMRALEELRQAGILESKSIGEARRAFLCPDILDTITWAERRLASTRFDTRASAPRPGTPAAPAERSPR